MSMLKATNHNEAVKLITLHAAHKIELAYEIKTDEFFELATNCCSPGDKIMKGEEYFIISLKGMYIPPND
jgi:hypothetical protein